MSFRVDKHGDDTHTHTDTRTDAGNDNTTRPKLALGNETLNTLRPRQNGRHFPDDIFKCIFLNENVWISIKISPKFVPRGPINYITTLIQIMAWHRLGDKPLSEPMMVGLLAQICVTRPQWVKTDWPRWNLHEIYRYAPCMEQTFLLSLLSILFKHSMNKHYHRTKHWQKFNWDTLILSDIIGSNRDLEYPISKEIS